MAEQINIFVENKPGRLRNVTRVLCEHKINIRAMVIQDSKDFGIMKLLVNDPRQANLALTGAGFACALKTVLAIVIDDKPGGLMKLAEVFFDNGINVLDAYGFVVESKKEAIWCVEVTDPEKTKAAVEKNGFRILTDSELYDL